MNGVRIGMEAILHHPRLIQLDLIRAPFACPVGAVGATTRGAVAYRVASTTRQATATAASACALSFSPFKNKLKAHAEYMQVKIVTIPMFDISNESGSSD